jgi:hypothetical protein
MAEARSLEALQAEVAARRRTFFSHCNEGNLTPAFLYAWELEHCALRDLLEAAQVRLAAETEMQALLADHTDG